MVRKVCDVVLMLCLAGMVLIALLLVFGGHQPHGWFG